MAETGSKSGRSSAAKTSRRKRTDLGALLKDIDFTMVRLFALEMQNTVQPRFDEKDDVDNRYGLVMNNVQVHDALLYGFCDVSASRSAGEEEVETLTASYFFLVSTKHSIPKRYVKKFAEHVCKASVWPNFQSIHGVISAQARFNMPRLPLAPQNIQFIEEDDEKSDSEPANA